MDYYCSSKFTDLMVHVQGRLLYNCCRALPERVTVEWLEQNPGRLFHTDTMLEDRELMLKNKSCASCHHGCYKYEDQGLVSIRQKQSIGRITEDPKNPLEVLSIVLSTDCNMSCIYCSPEYSTSWHRELKEGGDYVMEGQIITNNNWSQLWSKLKQKSRGTDSKFFSLLLREIELAKGLKRIELLGGEPLLNNQLDQIIRAVNNKKIHIVSGLGVDNKRLKTILQNLKDTKVRFEISGESTGQFFEFIRHGLSWKDFELNVKTVQESDQEIEFFSTLTNLSVFDFHNFYQNFHSRSNRINIRSVTDRPFLSPHVLDNESKEKCIKKLSTLSEDIQTFEKMIYPEPSDVDRKNLGIYLKQLSSRRNLKLDFLPQNFLKWCGITGN